MSETAKRFEKNNRSSLLLWHKMCVAHRHFDPFMSRQFLHSAYISAIVKRETKVCGSVWKYDVLAQFRLVTRLPKGFVIAIRPEHQRGGNAWGDGWEQFHQLRNR